MTNAIPAIGAIDDATQVRVALVRGQKLVSAPGQSLLSANVLDEDDMASDSATKVPSQQSVRAYVDVRNKPRFAARSLGILPEDLTAAGKINTAMQTISETYGGGIIEFEAARYDINETVLMQYPGVSLLGPASGWHSQINAGTNPNQWANQHSCFWQWDANTTGNKMLVIRPKNDTSVGSLNGVGFDGIVLEGNGVATHCLEILSVRNGWFPRIIASNAVTQNIHLGVVADGEISSSEPRDMQDCYFGTMLSRVWLANSLSTPGILIDGDDDADVSLCRFDYIQYIHKNALGLQIKSSDTCEFGMINGFRISGGSGSGVEIRGGDSVTDFPREHIFRYIQPGPGGLGVHARTVEPQRNVCLFYSLGNGSPAPSIDRNCGFNVLRYSNGTSTSFGNAASAVDIRRRDDTITSGTISDLIARAWDTASTPNLDDIAGVRLQLLSNTSGAEEGAVYFRTVTGGSYDNRFRINKGLELPTGQTILGANGEIRGTLGVFSQTSAITLATSDSGKVITNSGAAAKVAITLPAADGLSYFRFVVMDADGMDIVAASGDAIRIGGSVSSTSRTATSTTIGDTVLLASIDASSWVALEYSGTWTLT